MNPFSFLQRLSHESRQVQELRLKLQEIQQSYNAEIVDKIQYRRLVEENLGELGSYIEALETPLTHWQDCADSIMAGMQVVKEDMDRLEKLHQALEAQTQEIQRWVEILKKSLDASLSPAPAATNRSVDSSSELSIVLEVV